MDPNKHCYTQPNTEYTKEKCVQKQNLLVFDKNNPCIAKSNMKKTSYRVIPMKVANVKKIKICTGADLKRMCPPKLCECPAKARRRGFMSSVGRLLGFGVKGALAGGLMYYTYGIGLWGKPDETEQLYLGMCKYARKPNKEEMQRLLMEAKGSGCDKSCDIFKNRTRELAMEEMEQRGPKLSEDNILSKMKMCEHAPSIRENANCFKNCWNRFVICAFNCVMNLPNKLFGPKEEKVKSPEDEEYDRCQEVLKNRKE